ncbi:hypothetical protein QBC46DRAFT_436346 [Diplogelasinospora grovesii]|uniref:FHA domain-containing protein n=1 Tax=Diplogelasinospora grovesii TaxID=303347 RepID=A0AAN6S4D5_9PEZI|nr:hypothetical protein QBC46DRAFT_436346 [Diplogelasinospora grovesii]
MWLLESDLFEGRRLWLRPGKLYLFGRTASEPGQLAISDKTISRKHLTIQVDSVKDGGGRNLQSRSKVTVEDLNAKKGTLLNGEQIRGEKRVLSEDTNQLKLGLCSKVVRIFWHPVVLSFSFTSKELRADPWAKLRESLEQLDIKYSAEYETTTSHVVSKKRNTSKGLQALINGKYIVADSFINAIVEAATIEDGVPEGTPSALEQDYDGSWPNALEHLPPRGEEPVDQPAESYAPNERRKAVFDGYTFVFYDKKQYENLLAPITYGKGKALLKEVVPHKTDIDDFIRYVKGVAGEKGLESFEDGSEGKGVVVVRYMPAKGEDTEWFAQFLTSYALRLDHRPIDQREFLEAILACDASMLRRPLEEENQQPEQPVQPPRSSQTRSTRQRNAAAAEPESRMEVDPPDPPPAAAQAPEPTTQQEESAPWAAPTQRRGRARRGAASRFKGFDLEDEPMDESPAVEETPLSAVQTSNDAVMQQASQEQDSLFVSQQVPADSSLGEETQIARGGRRSQRKRPLSPLLETYDADIMESIAPSAAAAKRRRIEKGQDPIPTPTPEPEPEPAPTPEADKDEEMVTESPPPKNSKGKSQAKGKGKAKIEEVDILELARQKREEAEAAAAAERKKLEQLPDDEEIDYVAIRKLHIIEDCEVHFPDPEGNRDSRERAIADGRWDPAWNGRKNFKLFRKQGDPAGRPPARIIIGLEEERLKEYGIGDDYWLENNDDDNNRRKGSQSQPTQPTTAPAPAPAQDKDKDKDTRTEGPDDGRERRREKTAQRRRQVLTLDSSDEEEEEEVASNAMDNMDVEEVPEPSRTRAAKAAERANVNTRRSQLTQTQTQTNTQNTTQTTSSTRSGTTRATAKRAAAAPPPREAPPKRPRRGFQAQQQQDDDDDDSDDELKFRFGRRK